MLGQHTEYACEIAIEHHLTTVGGYAKGDREAFDPERGLFPQDVISFIQKIQPREWEYLANLQKEKAPPTKFPLTFAKIQKVRNFNEESGPDGPASSVLVQ